MNRQKINYLTIFIIFFISGILVIGCVESKNSTIKKHDQYSNEIVFKKVSNIIKKNNSTENNSFEEFLKISDQEIIQIAACINIQTDCKANNEQAGQAILFMGNSQNKLFIKPLIDLLWLEANFKNIINEALSKLTGEYFSLASEWESWSILQVDLKMPENYLKIKSKIYSKIDKNYLKIIENEYNKHIPIKDLKWIGASAQVIPKINNPNLINNDEQNYLKNADLIIGINVNGKNYAYPLKILRWHGVINETISGKSFVITYCPTMNIATAFENNSVGNLSLSSLFLRQQCLMQNNDGLLINSKSGIYYNGYKQLKRIPSMQTTWKFWKTYNQNSKVLSKDTGYLIDYNDDEIPYWISIINPENIELEYVKYNQDSEYNTLVQYEYKGLRASHLLYRFNDYRIIYDNLNNQRLLTIIFDNGIGARTFIAPPEEIVQISYTIKNGWLAKDVDNIYWFIGSNGLINQDDSSFYSEISNYISIKT